MAKKAKIFTLFNKNHISIRKTIFIKNDTESISTTLKYNNLCGNKYERKNKIEETIKCESPLGFYYYKTNVRYKTNVESTTIKEYIFSFANEEYVLTYTTSHNGNHIDTDLRPWNLYKEDKAMQDHFILALKNEIDKILDKVAEHKITKIYEKFYINGERPLNLNDLKKTIYKDIFGNEKTIRFQTNEEKILSHGFDLKISFRK